MVLVMLKINSCTVVPGACEETIDILDKDLITTLQTKQVSVSECLSVSVCQSVSVCHWVSVSQCLSVSVCQWVFNWGNNLDFIEMWVQLYLVWTNDNCHSKDRKEWWRN